MKWATKTRHRSNTTDSLSRTETTGKAWTCMGSRYFPDIFFFFSLGQQVGHMDVPGLGAESELQLPAYVTPIAMQDPSCIFDLHHSSQQHHILNPLSRAKDWTHVFMDSLPLSHYGNSFCVCVYVVYFIFLQAYFIFIFIFYYSNEYITSVVI